MPDRFKEIIELYMGHPLLFTTNLVITVCVGAVFLSIITNFLESRYSNEVENSKKSIVDTASMSGFFLVFYMIIRLNAFSIRAAIPFLGQYGLLVWGFY